MSDAPQTSETYADGAAAERARIVRLLAIEANRARRTIWFHPDQNLTQIIDHITGAARDRPAGPAPGDPDRPA